jgi:membrane protein
VIIFLLWLWIANLALLFGAEFDAELERGRQLQAGILAEEDVQLQPRGTRKSDRLPGRKPRTSLRGAGSANTTHPRRTTRAGTTPPNRTHGYCGKPRSSTPGRAMLPGGIVFTEQVGGRWSPSKEAP